MATKQAVYNGALRALGERRLASLTEDRASRRELDDAYDDVVATCLEAGYWNFAMRTVELEASTDVTPEFGLTYAYEKPTDWVRTYKMSANERFDPPLEEYHDEGSYFFCDVEPLYLRYVCNATDAGMNLALWPRSFTAYVELALARAVCPNVSSSAEAREMLAKDLRKAKADALAKDAMNQAVEFPPTGTWVQSRDGGLRTRSRWNGRFN